MRLLDDYKPNSHKSKEETEKNNDKKKVEKIVNGTVKVKKKNAFTKFKDIFILEDVSSVSSYILKDVIVPSLKKTLDDIITNGAHRLLYGESGRASNTPGVSKISYRSYYDKHSSNISVTDSRSKSVYSYDDIILDSRGEAEEVLDRLGELIDAYGMASVADLYDLVGVTGNYTDNNYGWDNLNDAKPILVNDGYMLRLPKARPLK